MGLFASGRTYSIGLDVDTDPATGKSRQVERGSDPFPSNLTVSEFMDRWLEHERARLRPTTHTVQPAAA